ncbi:Glycoside hydrolase [Parasponia andersonii]|uniref:Glycoside hydrolase n=1 Tax=Parasponia andersonii TaxID=3476 RepID=A0A2P5CWT3_PARAD|nr:Glycoside hydrolase [Parasponia andersonii]
MNIFIQTSLLLLLLLFLLACSSEVTIPNKDESFSASSSLNRSSFPKGFVFGTASSSYQYEGAANEGGRGASIWDTFVQRYPEKIKDHSSGLQAIDSYHRYKEDVGIMKDIGLDAHRLSISWSRLLPNGRISGGVNKDGIKYYNDLINELLSNGMQPFVTLFHWDLPQALEDAYGGFLSPKIVADFEEYAELCYKEFGDRVKHWLTLNEPLSFTTLGYGSGTFAPGRCSQWISPSCGGGDSSTEPYLVGHNQLLAHAAAVHIYKSKYQISQKGQIGIALNVPWMVPLSQSVADQDAANRALNFMYGWFMEPIKSGTYPAEMAAYVQERLPKFSKRQSSMLKGSFDFIGLNYYSASYVANGTCGKENQLAVSTDSCVVFSVPINTGYEYFLSTQVTIQGLASQAASDWLYIYPKGIEDLLLYTREKFNNPVIYITENGVDELNNGQLSLNDSTRIDYFVRHLSFIQSAIKKGATVKGYFAWSLLDNFEWVDGYTVRFGIVYVDYKDGLRRYLKDSAKWFKRFLH